jgi:hypothetical protein
VRQRIYNATVDGKQRVKLVGGIDSFGFCEKDEFLRVSLEVERTFLRNNLQLLHLSSLDDLGAGLLGIDSRVGYGNAVPKRLYLGYDNRLARYQVVYDATYLDHRRITLTPPGP